MTMHSVEYVWDMFDVDMSGEINEDEFFNLLRHLNHDHAEHIHPDNHEMRREIMRDLNAVKHHHAHKGKTRDHHNKHTLVILRPHFVELVAEGKLGPALRDDWILWAERQRIREHFLSDMLLILFLMHAPLSQRGFYFFDCVNVHGKWFLQADFTIQCFTDKHQEFVLLAMLFLVFFSFLFPVMVLLLLCRHRKSLHTPEIRHKFGHLYASFTVGAEYWEIHEVFRKMILTGLLVFIPGNSRPAIAIIVSVFSVASLNYFKPHKNYLVFYVAQMSFLVTTFKYLSVILLAHNFENDTSLVGRSNDSVVVGWLLVILDIVFMSVSFFTLFVVVVVLKRVLVKQSEDLVSDDTKIAPSSEGGSNSKKSMRLPAPDTGSSSSNTKVLPINKTEKTDELILEAKTETRKEILNWKLHNATKEETKIESKVQAGKKQASESNAKHISLAKKRANDRLHEREGGTTLDGFSSSDDDDGDGDGDGKADGKVNGKANGNGDKGIVKDGETGGKVDKGGAKIVPLKGNSESGPLLDLEQIRPLVLQSLPTPDRLHEAFSSNSTSKAGKGIKMGMSRGAFFTFVSSITEKAGFELTEKLFMLLWLSLEHEKVKGQEDVVREQSLSSWLFDDVAKKKEEEEEERFAVAEDGTVEIEVPKDIKPGKQFSMLINGVVIHAKAPKRGKGRRLSVKVNKTYRNKTHMDL